MKAWLEKDTRDTRGAAEQQSVGIDVIIPVHSMERPLRRAVESATKGAPEHLRVIVVCHNLPKQAMIDASGVLPSDTVEFHEFHDGRKSPAGPRNFGFSVSRGEYVAFLDSDDFFDEGALREWAEECARRGRPEVLVGQVHSQSRRYLITPCPRVGRFTRLSAQRDLLSDRTAPQGVLIRRAALEPLGADLFQVGAPLGEDLSVGLFIWNCIGDVAYSRSRAGYRLSDEGGDRITSAFHPLDTRLQPVGEVLEREWLAGLSPENRGAVARKLIRFDLINAIRGAARADALHRTHIAGLQALVLAVEQLRPGALRLLPLWETRVLRYIKNGDYDQLRNALQPSSHPKRVIERLFPGHVLGVFSPEQNYIRAFRTVLVRITLRRGSITGKLARARDA